MDAFLPKPGMDPEMEEPDDIMDLIEDMMEAVQPKYPSWLYKTDKRTGMRVLNPPKKPTKATFDDWIAQDEARFDELQRRFLDDIRMYRQMGMGAFEDFNPDFDTHFRSTEPTLQINKVASMIAGTPYNVSYPWRTRTERNDSEAMEEWALWFMRQWELQHRNSGSAELLWDLAWSGLVYGREVVRVTCDLEDGDFPWQIDVMDPATCFPTWGRGKHGLIRMSRKYVDTVGAVLDEYDANGSKGLAKKLGAHNNVDPANLEHEREVEVTECWTRWHHYVAVDGIEIKPPTAHEYGIVPFVYNLAPGEMGAVAAPYRKERLTRKEIKAGYTGGQRSRQFDMAEKGVSFLHSIKAAIAQQEAVASMHITALQQTLNPATITTNPYPVPPEPLDLGPGGNNERKPGQQTVPAVPSPKPLDSQPIMGMLQAEVAKGALPDVIFGQVEGSNVTGFASDTLMAAAKDRIQPFLSLTEKTLEDVLVLAAYLFRNFGYAADGLSDGALLIPRESRGGAPDGITPAKTPQWALPIMMQLVQRAVAPPPMAPAPMGAGPQPGGQPTSGIGPSGLPIPGGGQSMGPGPGAMPPPPGGAPPMMPGMPPMPGMAPPSEAMQTFQMVTGAPSPEDVPDVRIDREMLDRLTGRPSVKLHNIGLQNRTMLANYLSMLVQGKLMSRALAMDNIPEIRNSVAEWERIIAEDGQTNPAVMEKIGIPRMLWKQGDQDGFFTYWATVLLPAMAQSLAPGPGAPPSPGGPPPPGGLPQPPQSPQTVQGDSPAMLGMGPGSQGAPVGRPG